MFSRKIACTHFIPQVGGFNLAKSRSLLLPKAFSSIAEVKTSLDKQDPYTAYFAARQIPSETERTEAVKLIFRDLITRRKIGQAEWVIHSSFSEEAQTRVLGSLCNALLNEGKINETKQVLQKMPASDIKAEILRNPIFHIV